MTEYLTGAALYRAMADMLDGGREVQMRHASLYSNPQAGWSKVDGIYPAYTYRWKPVEKRTVTINGKVLVAPEVEAPELQQRVFYVDGPSVLEVVWQNTFLQLEVLNDGLFFLTREDAQAMSDWLTKCRLGQT